MKKINSNKKLEQRKIEYISLKINEEIERQNK